MIRQLPPEVRSRLRSGIATPTVAQCVEELVLNSIDAGATCVAVRVDLANYKIQVVDNGCGLNKDEMNIIGERYATSKCHDVKDLDNLSFFGYRGEALASISHMSGVLEIVSKTRDSNVTHSKLFRNGTSLNVFESSKQRPSPGTTITVHSIFQNLPVRRKMLSPSLDYERVRKRIQGLAIIQPKVSITLRDDSTGSVAIQTHSTSSIATTFGCLFGQEYTKVLKQVQHSKNRFKVSGFIGIEGHFNKKLQFVYVNKRIVLKTKFHKLANILLGRSLIAKRKVATEGKDPQRGKDGSYSDLSSPGRSQELYGILVLNVDCSLTDYDITLDPGKTLVEFKDWVGVLQCLEELIRDFLNRENLTMKLDKITSDSVVQEVDNTSQAEDEDSQENAVDLSEDVNERIADLSEKYGRGIHTSNCSNTLKGLIVRRGALQNNSAVTSDINTDSHIEDTILVVDDDKGVEAGGSTCEDNDGEKVKTRTEPKSEDGGSSDIVQQDDVESESPSCSLQNDHRSNPKHQHEKSVNKSAICDLATTQDTADVLVIPDSEDSSHTETPTAEGDLSGKEFSLSSTVHSESDAALKDQRTKQLSSQSDNADISIGNQTPHANVSVVSSGLDTGGSSLHTGLNQRESSGEDLISISAKKVKLSESEIGKNICAGTNVTVGKKRQQLSIPDTHIIPSKHFRKSDRTPDDDSPECSMEISQASGTEGNDQTGMVADIPAESTKDSDNDDDNMYKTPVGRLPPSFTRQISLTHTVSTLRSFRYRKSAEKVSNTSDRNMEERTKEQDVLPHHYHSSLQMFKQLVKPKIIMKEKNVEAFQTKSKSALSIPQKNLSDRNVPQLGITGNMNNSACLVSSTMVPPQRMKEAMIASTSHLQTHQKQGCSEVHSTLATLVPCQRMKETVVPATMHPQAHKTQGCQEMYREDQNVGPQRSNVLYELEGNRHTGISQYYNEASLSSSSANVIHRQKKPNLKRLRNQYNSNRDSSLNMNCKIVEPEMRRSPPVEKRFMTSESFLVSAQDILGIPPSASLQSTCRNKAEDINRQLSKMDTNRRPDGVWSVIEEDCRQITQARSASVNGLSSDKTLHEKDSWSGVQNSSPRDHVDRNLNMSYRPETGIQDVSNQPGNNQRHSEHDDGCNDRIVNSQLTIEQIGYVINCKDRDAEALHQQVCTKTSSQVHQECGEIMQHTDTYNVDFEKQMHSKNQTCEQVTADNSACTIQTQRIKLNALQRVDETCATKPVESSDRCSTTSADADEVDNNTKNVAPRSKCENRLVDEYPQECNRTEVAGSQCTTTVQSMWSRRFPMTSVDILMSDDSRYDNNSETEDTHKDLVLEKPSADKRLGSTQRFIPHVRDVLVEAEMSAGEHEKDFQRTSVQEQEGSDMTPQTVDNTLVQNSENVITLSHQDNSAEAAVSSYDSSSANAPAQDNITKAAISSCVSDINIKDKYDQESKQPSTSRVQCELSHNESVPERSNDPEQKTADCARHVDRTTKVTDGEITENKEAINQGWVAHYDPKKGQTVYVNILTGNCTSEKPHEDDEEQRDGETRKDFKAGASMSSSVSAFMTNTGQVHPHLSHNATPFLPRTNRQRLGKQDSDQLSDGKECAGTSEAVVNMVDKHLEKEGDDVASKWRDDAKQQDEQGVNDDGDGLQQLLNDWNEPSHTNIEHRILDIRSNHTSNTAVRIHGTLHPYKFTKAMFDNIKVMGQVDNKFIACMVHTEDKSSEPNLLILIDQHAAHERVRLEQLTLDAYEKEPDTSDADSEESEDCPSVMKTSIIAPPVQLTLSAEDVRLITTFKPKLHRLGLGINVPSDDSASGTGCGDVEITHLPACMVEREAHELRRGRQSIAVAMVESLIKEELDLLQDTSGASAVLPKTITKLLNSQACHGALKFGDKLALDECVTLIGQLSQCNLPFQCAHGRPSLIPVVDIKLLQSKLQHWNDSDTETPRLWKLKK